MAERNQPEMSEETFQSNFDLACRMKPDMTALEFYDILKSMGFNEVLALHRVLEIARADIGRVDRSAPSQNEKDIEKFDTRDLLKAGKEAPSVDKGALRIPSEVTGLGKEFTPKVGKDKPILNRTAQPSTGINVPALPKHNAAVDSKSTSLGSKVTPVKRKFSGRRARNASIAISSIEVIPDEQVITDEDAAFEEDLMYDEDFTSDEEDIAIHAKTGMRTDANLSQDQDLPPAISEISAYGSLKTDSRPFAEAVSKVADGQRGLANRQQKPEKGKRSNLADDITCQTTVTKWIGKLAGGLFVRTLLACGGEEALHDTAGVNAAAGVENMTMDALIDITTDPEKLRRAGWNGRDETLNVELLGKPFRDRNFHDKDCFSSAIVDDIAIRPGEFVTVRPGSDDHPLARKEKGGQPPPVAANIWFARIVYLFHGEEGSSAHVHWLLHGGDTVLGETAGPRELFSLDRCDDVPLGSIAGKVKVDFVGRDVTKGFDGTGAVELNYHDVNHYFYRLAYSEATHAFEEACDFALLPKKGRFYCDCCIKAEKEEVLNRTLVLDKQGDKEPIRSIRHKGITYEIHDFVYATQNGLKEPYVIAQIMDIKTSGLRRWLKSSPRNLKTDLRITLQRYGRHDPLMEAYFKEFGRGKGHGLRDCRHVYRDNSVTVTIIPDRLDGKCTVRHLEDVDDLNKFKDLEDTFYVTDQFSDQPGYPPGRRRRLSDLKPLQHGEMQYSESSEQNLAIEMSRMDAFLTTGHKLRAMDLFSGAGGLTTGLDQSEVIVTKWAIEWDTPAAETFKRNFPDTIMYNQDVNVVLKQAIDEHLGKSKKLLRDLCGKKLPAMPVPGEVDFIYGGPPCQDFSRCNQYQKANSIKNSMLATYLSYIDHYRPKYCLLENVQALLEHRLGSSQVDIHKTKGGIEMGSAKFILRALTSLGYQVQYSVLQAAEHGTPQSRLRVFFWGAAPGYELPKYPEPTNVFAGNVPKTTRRTRRSAPHLPVTVGDAISDLPPFDWDMNVRGETKSELYRRTRRADKIPFVNLVDWEGLNRLGGDNQTYASANPLSEYQREARRGVTSSLIYNAYSCNWLGTTLERIIRIPLRPGASHLDIPAEYDMRCLRSEETAAVRHNFYPDRYRRLDYDGLFQTCLTKIDPSGKNGSVLHPSQYRVITVREQARAMGFPDGFSWDEDQAPRAMYKQIGNAVAIPVARALGRELWKVVVRAWEQKEAALGAKNTKVIDPGSEDDEAPVGASSETQANRQRREQREERQQAAQWHESDSSDVEEARARIAKRRRRHTRLLPKVPSVKRVRLPSDCSDNELPPPSSSRDPDEYVDALTEVASQFVEGESEIDWTGFE